MKGRIIFVAMALLLSVASVAQANKTAISQKEKDGLVYMLEEEKLARDVYDLMFEKWGSAQFENITQSERRHMAFVENLLVQFQINYSIPEAGKFDNPILQNLYNKLVSEGLQSEVSAFRSGATIEDVDIYDLQKLKKETKNAHIIRVYNYLECGSKNHLRAFNRGLERNDEKYEPVYLSKNEMVQIITGPNMPCGQQRQ